MPALIYGKFEVSASPEQLGESGTWTQRVLITTFHETRNETKGQFFKGKETLPSREEAEAQSLIFGRKILDGEFPEHSLMGLL